MTERPDLSVPDIRSDRARREILLAVVLSVLIHVALMLGLPRLHVPISEKLAWGDASTPLSVNLVPPSPPPAPPVLHVPVPPAPQARSPQPVRPSSPAAPSAAERYFPQVAPVLPPHSAFVVPERSRPSPGGDLSSYIEAQRRARAVSEPVKPRVSDAKPAPAEDDKARSERIVAANLGAQRAPAFGYDPARKGGAFQLQRVGYNDAEFIFYGWNKEVNRNMAQLIEVERGGDTDIRIAVVRRIIAIIRDFESGDFLWESARLGRNLTLSARPRDNAALEEFMMHEFFSDARQLR